MDPSKSPGPGSQLCIKALVETRCFDSLLLNKIILILTYLAIFSKRNFENYWEVPPFCPMKDESLGLKTKGTGTLGLIPILYKIFELVLSQSRLG